MKRNIISVFILAITFGFFNKTKAQNQDSLYESRKLKIDEVNFVSGYYTQEGNHSSIGGGKGDEALTNISNTIQLRLVKNAEKFEHRFDISLAVDHHTSASTKLINTNPLDPNATQVNTNTAASSGTSGVSGASSKFIGWRIYPSINYSAKDLKRNITYGVGAYYSREFDYQSIGGELSFIKASQDNNTEFSIKTMAFFDQRLEILPVELRPVTSTNTGKLAKINDDDEYKEHDDKKQNYKLWNKNSYSVNLAFSQIINPRLQMSLLADFAYQEGLLSVPYNRVYFTNNTVASEKLPMQRMKIPLGVRLNYFMGETFIFRTYYRYFFDDWGIKAHTAQLEIPVKLSPFLSISPFYRYHHQTSNDYFKPYGEHAVGEKYYSSDYDLSTFTSQNIGLNLHYLPLDPKIFKNLDLRYSFYKRSEGMSAHNITLAVTFK